LQVDLEAKSKPDGSFPPSFGHCRIQWLDPKADVRLADGFVPEAVPDAPLRHPNECL
jgi:hypothetical protein